MKNIFLTLAAFSFLTACDRLKLDDQSKIQIQLPELSADTKLASQKVTTLNGALRPEPTGFDGARPINCYLVAVGGPEESLRRNTCMRKNGTMTPKLVGPWVGGVVSGGTLNLDVDSGVDRVFHVVGFYAAEGACKDFKANGFPPDSLLSKPYIMGTLEKVTLRPGETKDLPIQIAYNSDSWFDGCDGPDFPDRNDGDGGSGGGPATKVILAKDYFPHGIFEANACQSVDAHFKNASGGSGNLESALTFQLSINSTPTTMYSSYYNCQMNVGGFSSSTFNPGFADRQLYFKTPVSPTPFTLAIGILSGAPAGFTAPSKSFNSASASSNTFRVDGPERLLPGLCYPIEIERRTVNNMGASDISSALSATLTTVGLQTFSDGTCSSGVSSLAFAMSQATKTIYALLPLVATEGSLTVTASGYTSPTLTFHPGNGTNVPFGIEVRGDTMMGSGGGCSDHPYSARVYNQYGVPVVLSQSFSFAVSTANPELTFHSDQACASGSPSVIPVGAFKTNFYISRTNLASGTINLQIAGDLGLVGSYPISIDGPDNLQLQNLGSASVPSSSCVPMRAFVQNLFSGVSSSYAGSANFLVGGGDSNIHLNTYSDPGCMSPVGSLNFFLYSPADVNFYVKPYLLNGMAAPKNITMSLSLSGAPLSYGPSLPLNVTPSTTSPDHWELFYPDITVTPSDCTAVTVNLNGYTNGLADGDNRPFTLNTDNVNVSVTTFSDAGCTASYAPMMVSGSPATQFFYMKVGLVGGAQSGVHVLVQDMGMMPNFPTVIPGTTLTVNP